MKNKRFIKLSCLIISFLLCSLSNATDVDAQGSAPINGNIVKARHEAYQDALRQASLYAGVNISAHSTLNNNTGQITDSIQMRSAQSISSAEIIHESIENNILTVTISAEINLKENNKNSCDFPASQYRKKIAATFFPLLHPEQLAIQDYYGFDQQISTEILKRLAISGNFLTREAKDVLLYNNPAQAPYISQSTTSDDTLLSQLALQRDVQYVISGVIRDVSAIIESRHIEEAPFLPSFNTFFGKQRRANKRNLVIDFFLHDTLTGELISKTSYSESVHDNNAIPDQAIVFGSRAFFDTAYGRMFSKVLDKEVANIQKQLRCRPFTMRVIDEKEGKLYLDAGIGNNVRVGDVLTVYVPDKPGEVFGIKGKIDQFGTPKSKLIIDHVYPAYSTATADFGVFTQQDIINGYLIAW